MRPAGGRGHLRHQLRWAAPGAARPHGAWARPAAWAGGEGSAPAGAASAALLLCPARQKVPSPLFGPQGQNGCVCTGSSGHRQQLPGAGGCVDSPAAGGQHLRCLGCPEHGGARIHLSFPSSLSSPPTEQELETGGTGPALRLPILCQPAVCHGTVRRPLSGEVLCFQPHSQHSGPKFNPQPFGGGWLETRTQTVPRMLAKPRLAHPIIGPGPYMSPV